MATAKRTQNLEEVELKAWSLYLPGFSFAPRLVRGKLLAIKASAKVWRHRALPEKRFIVALKLFFSQRVEESSSCPILTMKTKVRHPLQVFLAQKPNR